ncbi:hypothetical protein PCA10_03410 [Metapseudomonas resinovorans NBRC 106553]|uniref:Uncharacterized protein n=1 Tax=Metapseudomonas resinovorans NBRC 106553 TaxID=1245471 RepID=S6AL99_METRE|nr:hypothetical protein PCA10_03410 [Pseudomonas resinovorans NBRC 106553]
MGSMTIPRRTLMGGLRNRFQRGAPAVARRLDKALRVAPALIAVKEKTFPRMGRIADAGAV